MTIYTVNKKKFELKNVEETVIGSIEYQSSNFSEAVVLLADTFNLQLIATGVWVTIFNDVAAEKVMTNIKVEAGGTMSIRKFYKRKKYTFKKSANWKLRFSLFNADGDELLTIVPTVNWKNESHDFNLQLNEDFENECDAFLILQALHCANCSLSMMQGGSVPALISA
ncbi:MAG: hypothetical protein IPP48_15485 [Chitinophagaceae bacterium]|nr:hypothetical protein [Chitinophagaceae bacterium]